VNISNVDSREALRRARALHHYEDHVAFFYAKLSASAAAIISFLLTNEMPILLAAVGMLAIMLFDISNIQQQKKLLAQPDGDFADWEYHYTFLSTFFMLLVGLWCFFSFTLTKDLFIHLLCVSIAMGNVLTLLCRNFSNERILTLQLFAVGIPLILGVLSYGDYRSLVLCTFFLPLFSSVRDISGRLRSMFRDLERQSDEKEAFGVQLNEALESMSHGLLMFDETMHLKIINKTAREILDIEEDFNCYHKSLKQIARMVDFKKPLLNRVRVLEENLSKRLHENSIERIFKISETQYLELSMKMRNDGGCVLVIEDVTQRIEYQMRINELAKFDELTGLCNRSFFLQQATSKLRLLGKDEEAALIFFDLDDFKRVNDTLGHEAGDYILTNVAERLRNILPRGAIAARYGGDEFVIYVRARDCRIGIETLADQIVSEISTDLQFNNQVLRFGISAGVAVCPNDGRTVERLLKLADLALYAAKGAGKNQYYFFTAELEETLQKRILLEDDLAEAIHHKKLDLHFQPIIGMDSGKVEVFEALTRWKREGLEVPPDIFIPLAEDLGLIRAIGEWTLLEACRQCKTWPEEIRVAVNLSAVQFQVGSVIQAVRNALDETGLEPSRLEVEITETAVLNDMSHAVVVLEALSEIGVGVSLDDFGTGYSSLSYLHKLPLDKLKIDKSFVDNIADSPRSRTLLKGVTVLGKALHLKVVVEGVETQAQFDLLREHYDVDLIQGWLFSRALPAGDTREYAWRSHGKSTPQDEAIKIPHIHMDKAAS